MADITKKVDRGIPANQRSQIFDQTDAGSGDVVLVKESLGRHAQQVTIDSVGGMTIRLNVYRTIFPQRTTGDGMTQWWPGLPNIAKGQQVKDDTNAAIVLGANETFELSNEMPITDIEIVSATGDFTIVVT